MTNTTTKAAVVPAPQASQAYCWGHFITPQASQERPNLVSKNDKYNYS